ncbi:MAG: hypothetical protein AAF632_18715 [Bacteroidota bacterium]
MKKIPLIKVVTAYFFVAAFTLMPELANAQGIAQGAQNAVTQFISIANILFPALGVAGILAAAGLALLQNPAWKRALVFALVAFAIWGGYQTFRDEIFSYWGGGLEIS